MQCQNCEWENDVQGAKYCPFCGVSLDFSVKHKKKKNSDKEFHTDYSSRNYWTSGNGGLVQFVVIVTFLLMIAFALSTLRRW